MSVHELTRAQARQIALRAQLLTAERLDDVVDVVEHLTAVQIDPIAAVAPSADLVLWSRIGSAYDGGDLRACLDDHALLEHQGYLRHPRYLALCRAEMAHWPGEGELRPWQEQIRGWVDANEECRLDILQLLDESGPLTSRELPDTCAVPWGSSGWTNNKNVTRLLDFMVARGEVAVAGRRGRDRTWDLVERVWGPDPLVVPAPEARRERALSRLRALGLARARVAEVPGEPYDVGEIGEPAVVEGVKGQWRVDPDQLDRDFAGRAALLSPFDRLVHDRKRAAELFDFDYQLEMYKPVAKRRWGYYALPILYADRLVGKLDASADRLAGVLWIDAVHEDVPFTRAMTRAVDAEIDDLARWLDLEPQRT